MKEVEAGWQKQVTRGRPLKVARAPGSSLFSLCHGLSRDQPSHHISVTIAGGVPTGTSLPSDGQESLPDCEPR